MYCEYWNLHRAPFDDVPDPSMYADCHTSMDKVISETLFAIKEANDAFAVIIGTVGSGKTLSLRMISDSLEPDQYKIVIITNPGISFSELLKEIIGQVSGQPCEENRKTSLLEIFNRLLLAVNNQGQKIVIFIDEANTLSPANLENLRLLTNIQDGQSNLFTLVLVGQMDLARRLEHPKRANLFQRISSYCRIDKLPSEEAVRMYVETRLKLAGANHKIFSDDCIPIIWEYSEHGVPRLVNKICKLCLKAGETNNFINVSSDIVVQISERFQKLGETAIQKRRPRHRLENSDVSGNTVAESDEGDALPTEASSDHDSEITETFNPLASEQESEIAEPTAELPVPDTAGDESASEISLIEQSNILEETPAQIPSHNKSASEFSERHFLATNESELQGNVRAEVVLNPALPHEAFERDLQTTAEPPREENLMMTESPIPDVAVINLLPEITPSIPSGTNRSEPEETTLAEILSEEIPREISTPNLQTVPAPQPVNDFRAPDQTPSDFSTTMKLAINEPEPEITATFETPEDTEIPDKAFPSSTIASSEVKSDEICSVEEKNQKHETERYDEVIIGEHRIELAIPKDILLQVKSFNRESANKSAGFWAAQIIKKNPQLTHSPLADPVYIWNEIKDSILRKIAL